jgi:uncharacterized membrane protein YeiH
VFPPVSLDVSTAIRTLLLTLDLLGTFVFALSGAVAGVLIFFWYPSIKGLRSPVLVFDAAGLALFCVAGAQKALVFGLSPVMAALLGMLTGVGGGVARDVPLSEIPVVLRSDFYAVAALAGAAVLVTGDALGLPGPVSACAGAALCFGPRLAAIRLDWHLPVARAPRLAADDAGAAARRDEG